AAPVEPRRQRVESAQVQAVVGGKRIGQVGVGQLRRRQRQLDRKRVGGQRGGGRRRRTHRLEERRHCRLVRVHQIGIVEVERAVGQHRAALSPIGDVLRDVL